MVKLIHSHLHFAGWQLARGMGEEEMLCPLWRSAKINLSRLQNSCPRKITEVVTMSTYPKILARKSIESKKP
jgi:hypothetical protein